MCLVPSLTSGNCHLLGCSLEGCCLLPTRKSAPQNRVLDCDAQSCVPGSRAVPGTWRALNTCLMMNGLTPSAKPEHDKFCPAGRTKHHGNRGSQPFQSMARFVGDHLLLGPLQPPSRDSASQCSLWMPHSIFQSPHAGHSSHIGLSQPMPPLGASLHSFCQVNPSRPPGLSLDVTSSRKSSKTA